MTKVMAFLLLHVPVLALAQTPSLSASPERLEARIAALSQFGAEPGGGVSRVAYSDADLAGRAYVMGLLRDLGLEPRIDAAGNILARRSGAEPDLAPILFGSHIDSVPHGGNYDGDVGVMSAIEVMQLLRDNGITTRHPFEFVVFANEEAVLIGSKAFAGLLDAAELDEMTHSGLTIREGIEKIGGDPNDIAAAQAEAGDYTAYIELHIEQGAILDDAGLDIGVVQGIVGIDWWDITVTGEANHAGTTPMDKRHDALLTASKLVLAVNRTIRDAPGRQVGTVGRIKAFPGAPNVVPGRVEASLEIRDLSSVRILEFFERIEAEAQRIALDDGTKITFRKSPIHEEAAETVPRIRDIIAAAAEERGYSYKRMPSGAGHDAQAIAHIAPIGMVFVPSEKGISHAPTEFTHAEDMAKGANVLLDALLAIDRNGLD